MRTGPTLQRGFSQGMCSTQMCNTHVERHIWEPSHEILHGQAETRLGWLTIKKVKFLIKLCIVQNPTALNLTNDRYKSLKNIIKHSLGMHRFLVITPEIIQYNIYLYHIYIALVIWSTRKAYCIILRFHAGSFILYKELDLLQNPQSAQMDQPLLCFLLYTLPCCYMVLQTSTALLRFVPPSCN